MKASDGNRHQTQPVMAGLGPAIHDFRCRDEDVDARPAPGMTMRVGGWVS
jgi:hypothetical protein